MGTILKLNRKIKQRGKIDTPPFFLALKHEIIISRTTLKKMLPSKKEY